jgi:ABC-2 type transport system permease protein
MSKIKGMMKTSIRENLAYKFDMMMTVILAPISIVISYFLWKTIFAYNGTAAIGGFTFQELITYYVINWVVGILIWTDVGDMVSYDIKNGNIAKNLILPINYLTFSFVYTISSRIMALFFEALPILLISLFVFNIKISLVALPLFVLSLILALILNFLITSIFALSAFWMTENRGIMKLKRVLVHFLSGAVLPIAFFPLAYQKVSTFLPFQYLEYVPINFWLQKYNLNQGMFMLGMQVVWIVVFYLLCLLIWRRAITKATSVGI